MAPGDPVQRRRYKAKFKNIVKIPVYKIITEDANLETSGDET